MNCLKTIKYTVSHLKLATEREISGEHESMRMSKNLQVSE